VEILAESAVRVTVLALGVAVVLRALRLRSPRAAHRAWSVVVVVMLLLPAFVALGPELRVPLLPAHITGRIAAPAADDVATARADVPMAATVPPGATRRSMAWAAAAMTIYLLVVAFFVAHLAVGLHRVLALRRTAVQVRGRLTHQACVVPMTVGVVAPVIILPADWASWDDAELSAVLAHEEEHVRRRDPFVAAVTLFNRAIFWFHPLAWWLTAEIARLSEEACDAVVISRGHDCDVYSACLLRFARRVTNAGGRIMPVATAMPGSGLQERLGMIAQPPARRPSTPRLASAVGACAALVVVSAAARPTARARAATEQAAPSQAQAAWVVQTSEHFEIFHDRLPADRVNDTVRDAETAYAQLSAALKHDLPRQVPIILVRRDRDLSSAVEAGRDVALQGGQPAGQRIVVSVESLDRRTNMLVHELTHQFAFDIIPDTSRLAPFLIEGLAEYQRGVWRAEDLRTLRTAAAAGAIPSVANLDTVDRRWAHAVFDFVGAEHGQEGVRRLLFALRAHAFLEPAVTMAFGVTLDEFDRGFRGFVQTRLAPQ
jgi:beta-lactamase regulating signal transducer with metallopeptidase domain